MNKELIRIINQVFELEKKIGNKPETQPLLRHIERIKSTFEDLGLFYHNPAGEKYNETRTDCEANIVGELAAHMVISEVIKPIVFEKTDMGHRTIIQKAVVLVEKSTAQ
jgi:hypothetical protein